MKLLSVLMIFSAASFCFAEVDKMVLIRGKVGGSFDEKMIQVEDRFGQKFNVPKSFFDKAFIPSSGKKVSVEIPENLVRNLKQQPKKK